MSTIITNQVTSPSNTVARDLVIQTSSVDRLRVNALTGNITVPSTMSVGNVISPTFNGYVPVNRAGDTMTGTLQLTGAGELRIFGQTAYHAGNANRQINRGNPGAGSTLLLSRFDESHFYSADGVSSLAIATTMVENAVYQVSYSLNGSSENVDIVIQPNFTTYASQFTSTYFVSYPTAPPLHPPPVFIGQVLSNFYFDHQAGGSGNTPSGTFIIYNYRAKKQVQYYGGDTLSHASGTGRWNNSTDQWLNVGNLTGFTGGSLVRAIVRRIG